MITKQELIKMLNIAIQDKYEIEGQIKLLQDQLRMVMLKEQKIQEKIKEDKKE